MNELQLPEGVDKLTTAQKAVALGIIGVGLYFILPFLIAVMVNLYITVALAIPILYVLYNPYLIWGLAKTISWKLTKGIIGLDPLSAMDRYLDWVQGKHESIKKSRLSLQSTLVELERQVEEKERSKVENEKRALTATNKGFTAEAELAATNALSDKDFLMSLIPMRDNLKVKVEYLGELDEVFGMNAKQLEYKITNVRTQYESTKKIMAGMKNANDVIGGVSDAKKLFDESVRQTNEQMSRMTANIQMFENNIKPALDSAKFDKQVKSDEARQLIEDLKRNNNLLRAGK